MGTFNTLKAAVGLGVLVGGLFATNAVQAGLPALSVSGNRIIQNGQPYMLGGIGLSGDSGIYPSPPWRDSTNKDDLQNYANALNFFKGAVDLVTNRGPLYGRNYGWGARMIRFGLTPDWFDPNRDGTSYKDDQFIAYVDNVVAPLCAYCQQKGVYIILDTGYVTNVTTFMLQHDWPQYNQSPSKGVIYRIWNYMANSAYDNHNQHAALRDTNVLYELYNEPTDVEGYIKNSGIEAAWKEYAGRLQLVVDHLRNDLGNTNVCLIGTMGSDSQPQWILQDPIAGSNLGYVEHIYPGGNYPSTMSVSDAYTRIDNTGNYGANSLGQVAASVPLVVTEFYWFQNGSGGDNTYTGTTSVFGKALRQWINDKAAGYDAWTYGEMLTNRFDTNPNNGLDSNSENYGQSTFEMLWVTFFYSGGQVPYQFNGNAVYRIVPQFNTNSCLDVYGRNPADQTPVYEWQTGTNQDNQQWYFQNLNNGRYRVTPQFNTNSALDVKNGYATPNTDVREYTWNGSPAQQWWVTSLGDGSYRLTAGCWSDGALDIYGGGSVNQTRVDEYSWNGGATQRFYIWQQ